MKELYKKLSPSLKEKFKRCRLLAMDFDGVLTNDMVYVSQDGKEMVRCSRFDGFASELLRTYTDVAAVIVSKELNPVVKARTKKLKTKVVQSRTLKDKLEKLSQEIKDRDLTWNEVLYMGNDLNDIACIKKAGIGVAVKNAHPVAIKAADYVTTRPGGEGAMREVCELLMIAKGHHPAL